VSISTLRLSLSWLSQPVNTSRHRLGFQSWLFLYFKDCNCFTPAGRQARTWHTC